MLVENAAARKAAADALDVEATSTRDCGIVVAAFNEPSIVLTVIAKRL